MRFVSRLCLALTAILVLTQCSQISLFSERLATSSSDHDNTWKLYPEGDAPESPPFISEEGTPALSPQGSVKVGLLLPLSGDNAAVGKSLQQAAELALFQTGARNLRLLPFDTEGTPDGGRKAAQEAVSEDVAVILGPLFSQVAETVAPIAGLHQIPVLSFSNNRSLEGKGIFLLGFNPEEQATRITKFAYEQGYRSYSVLAPENTYGHMMVDTMATALAPKDIGVRDAQYYKNMGADLSESIIGIVKLSRKLYDEGTPEALFIPEGGQALFSIASRLSGKGIVSSHLQLIGSGQWDDEAVLRHPKLQGGWFATSDISARDFFEQTYRDIYKETPPRIASLAYDAVALCAALAKAGEPFTDASIRNPRGFSGINGAFRFSGSDIAERLLAVVEVTQNGLRTLDPAPNQFD
ncbi:MAG: penicillin-binding protein activator [Hyphomicrobiales bacterium]|nr:penicillin-binding protein activator [Hyphomicrobiales bacterium]